MNPFVAVIIQTGNYFTQILRWTELKASLYV